MQKDDRGSDILNDIIREMHKPPSEQVPVVIGGTGEDPAEASALMQALDALALKMGRTLKIRIERC